MMLRHLLLSAIVLSAAAMQAKILPDGLYYEKVDFLQTASEDLYFTFTFAPEDQSKLAEGVRYEIKNLDNQLIKSGVAKQYQLDGKLAVYTILDKAEMAKLPTDYYNLAIAPVDDKELFDMKFYVDTTPYRYRAVYLLDNADAEEYAMWLNQDFPGQIEPLHSFPDLGTPDLTVISSYRAIDEATVKQLQNFVQNGGTILMFGLNHPDLDALNPLSIDRTTPYNTKASTLASKTFPSLDGQNVFLVNARTAPGAETLATAADGKTALAVKTIGKGKVYAFAGAIKPNEAYATLIQTILGAQYRKHAPRQVNYDNDGFQIGISANNVGRFGFTNNDRVNDISIRPEQTFRMWDFEPDTFGVSFTDVDTPAEISCKNVNFLSKTMCARGGRFGKETLITFGLGTPGVLFQNPTAQTLRFASPMLQNIAFVNSKNELQTFAVNEPAPDLSQMTQNYILAWAANDRFDAWPLLITFNRKIKTAAVRNGELVVDFAKPGLEISVMPLAGIKHYPAGQLPQWDQKVLSRWAAMLAARTVGCVESFKETDGKVLIRNRFEYLLVNNDWGIEPLKAAFLPPLVPIYAKTKFASFGKEYQDLDFATFHGPLYGVAGKDVSEYTLAAPDLSYNLPTSPVDPRLDAPVNRALFERIIEHLNTAKLLCIPARGFLVEPPPGKTIPNRDLKEATEGKFTTDTPEWKYIDLHLTLGGVTGNLMFRPYLNGAPGNEDVKQQLETKINRNVQRDIEYFTYKTFLRYRKEPLSGNDYLAAFIAPVRYGNGYRTFHDMNETCGVVMQTLALYDLMYQDKDFLVSNARYIDQFMSYMHLYNDWTWMCSMAVEWGMGNNIDMLNAELTAWSGKYHLDQALGRKEEAAFDRYMAAKAAAATGARLFFGDFYNSLNFPIPAQLKPVIHEMTDAGQAVERNRYLPYQLCQGYGEGWPSLWPAKLDKGTLKHTYDGKDLYSTSKGVPMELLNLYRSSPEMTAVLVNYENVFRAYAYQENYAYLYTRIAGSSYINNDSRKEIEKRLYRALNFGGMSAKNLGMGTADWETTAMTILLEMLRQTADSDDSRFTVPVSDEKGGKILWEAVEPKANSGQVKPSCQTVSADKEPANVGNGFLAVKITMAAPGSGNVPVVFTRFDKAKVIDQNCRALSFLIKSDDAGGAIDIALPETNWKKTPIATVKINDSMRDFKRVRLEFDRDFKFDKLGMTVKDIRGELFLYNGQVPGPERRPVTVYLDDIRFEQ